MKREHNEVYSPPEIKTVSFVVEIGLDISATPFALDTWDEDSPGSRSSLFERDDWTGDGNATTSFEIERW